MVSSGSSHRNCSFHYRNLQQSIHLSACPKNIGQLKLQFRGNGQHILYLDDEEMLVELTPQMLNLRGYRVTGFTQPQEALRAFRENPQQFALVVTDLNMPGFSGLDVAAEILRIRADVPVVLISSHVTEELQEHARRIGIRQVIYKPMTMEEFGAAIDRSIAAGMGGRHV